MKGSKGSIRSIRSIRSKRITAWLLAVLFIFSGLYVPGFRVRADGEGGDEPGGDEPEIFVIQDGELVAYKGAGAVDVTIPDNITKIGREAFAGAEITGVSFPDTVTEIGPKAFYGCAGLTSLDLPAGLTTIGAESFAGCGGLTGTLEIPDSIKTISTSAFSSLQVNKVVLGTGLSVIDDRAFYGCGNVAEVIFKGTVPPQITSDGHVEEAESSYWTDENAAVLFGSESMPGLLFITVPASFETIFSSRYGNYLRDMTRIRAASSNEFEIVDGVLTAYYGISEEVTIPSSVNEIGEGVFSDNELLKRVIIPSGVVKIGDGAFSDCTALTEISLPASVKEIGDRAFSDCKGIVGTLNLPDGLEKIGDDAFSDCESLSGDLTIPDSVTELGDGAFSGCTGLNGKLTLSSQMTEIGRDTFSGCGFTGELTIPEGITAVWDNAFQGCALSGTLTVSDTVKTIGSGAFSGIQAEKLMFGSGLTVIDCGAFSGCSRITEAIFMGVTPPAVSANGKTDDPSTYSGSNAVILFSDSSSVLTDIYVNGISLDTYKKEWTGLSSRISSDCLCFPVAVLTAEYLFTKSLKLTWMDTKKKNITGYYIYKNGTLVGNQANCFYTGTIEAGATDVYQVSAYDASGNESPKTSFTVSPFAPELIELGTDYIGHTLTAEDGAVYAEFSGVYDGKNAAGRSITADFYYYNSGDEKVKIGSTIDDPSVQNEGVARYNTNWDVSRVPDGTYTLEVVLTDPDGGSFTFTGTVSVRSTKPAAVSGVKATGGYNRIILTWNASAEENVAGYNIFRKAENETEFTALGTVSDRNTVTYTDRTSIENKTYSYYITAVDDIGQDGEASAIVSASPVMDHEPAVITSFSPEGGTMLGGTVNFRAEATDNFEVAGIILYYSLDDGRTWLLLHEAEGSELSCEVDVTAWGVDNFRVRAVADDVAGNIGISTDYIYTIDRVGPEKVTGLKFTGDATSITLSWNAVSDEDLDHYQVEVKENGSFVPLQNAGKELSLKVTNVQAGVTYNYRVVAYDIHGNRGTESNVIPARTVDQENIAPSISQIQPMSGYVNKTVTVTLTARDDVGIYQVVVQTSLDAKSWTEYSTHTFDGNNLIETVKETIDLDEFPEGPFYVRGVPKDIYGQPGNTASSAKKAQFTIDRTPPAVPSGLYANTETGDVVLKWKVNMEADFDSFQVYHSLDGENYDLLVKGLTAPGYTDTSLTYDVDNYYTVAALDKAGNLSEMCEPVIVNLPHPHHLQYVAAKDATTEEEGNLEYWICTICNLMFMSEDGIGVYAPEDVIVPKLPLIWPFSDVEDDPEHWAYAGIRYVYVNKIMTGDGGTDWDGKTTFRPRANIKRCEFVQTLYVMNGSPEVSGTLPFTDVKETAYYYDALRWAYSNGIVSGATATSFSPKKEITRQEMASMMKRLADHLKIDTSAAADITVYPDYSNISSWAIESMAWANSAGLISGKVIKDKGVVLLAPKDNTTRQECASVLMRFHKQFIKEKEGN